MFGRAVTNSQRVSIQQFQLKIDTPHIEKSGGKTVGFEVCECK